MLRIAICDDDKNGLENAITYLNSYANNKEGLSFKIHTFDNADTVLKYVNKNGPFDIYLLDIILKQGMLGTTLAKELTAHGKAGQIIFLTSSRDFAVEAFNVNATHYLLKPYSKVSFFAALDRAIANLDDESDELVLQVIGYGLMKISISNISYVESKGHYQYIAMSDGTIHRLRCSTKELTGKLLARKDFIRPHAGFAVNMNYIKTITNDYISVVGATVPITKNQFSKVKKAYLDYVFLKGGK